MFPPPCPVRVTPCRAHTSSSYSLMPVWAVVIFFGWCIGPLNTPGLCRTLLLWCDSLRINSPQKNKKGRSQWCVCEAFWSVEAAVVGFLVSVFLMYWISALKANENGEPRSTLWLTDAKLHVEMSWCDLCSSTYPTEKTQLNRVTFKEMYRCPETMELALCPVMEMLKKCPKSLSRSEWDEMINTTLVSVHWICGT